MKSIRTKIKEMKEEWNTSLAELDTEQQAVAKRQLKNNLLISAFMILLGIALTTLLILKLVGVL